MMGDEAATMKAKLIPLAAGLLAMPSLAFVVTARIKSRFVSEMPRQRLNL